jgi:hypothetical protein
MRALRFGLAALLVVGAWSGRAAAFDLTGTWTGTTKCTSFFQGEKFKFTDEPTIQITQNGDLIGVRADYGGGDVDVYTGRAYPDAKKPDQKGEVGLAHCGTDDIAGNPPDFDEIGRFSVSTKVDKVKATVKGVSFFSDPGVAMPEAGTCKWKLTRVDTTNAAVSTTCPASGVLARSGGTHSRRR